MIKTNQIYINFENLVIIITKQINNKNNPVIMNWTDIKHCYHVIDNTYRYSTFYFTD